MTKSGATAAGSGAAAKNLFAGRSLPQGIRRTVQTQNELEAGHMISVRHVSAPAFQSRYSASRRLGARDGRQALACQQQWFHFLAQRAATIQFRQPVAAYAVWEACGHHHQMEYAMPAIRRALTITVAMPAVSRMESCQSCFGSNAMLHCWRQQSGGIDLDHGVVGAPATFPYIRGSAASNAMDSGHGRTADAHFRECIQHRHRELFSSTVVKKRTAPV